MARKGKKRREARRQRQTGSAGGVPEPSEAAAGSAEEAPAAPVAAEKNRRVPQKRKKSAARRIRVSPWWFTGVGAVAAVALFAYLVATSGSSGSSAPPQVTASPDPRVAGLVPALTLNLEAGGSDVDAYFQPTTLSGPAGEAVEIVIQNTGTLDHNLTVAGVDEEYDTSDDWVSIPKLIKPGEEGRLVLKIDEPGTYAFQCSLHPQLQFGSLVLK